MSVIERLLRRDGGAGGDGLTLAPMRKRDIRAGVLDIEAQCYPVGWSQNVFNSEVDQMRSGSRHYVVARRAGRIVGYAGLWFAVDEAHVTNVAVDPAERRRGVATELMLHLSESAIAQRCVAMTLEVRVSSVGAQDLYRRFGFAPAGIRQKYYDNVEDAIVMWCHDIATPEFRDRLNDIRERRS